LVAVGEIVGCDNHLWIAENHVGTALTQIALGDGNGFWFALLVGSIETFTGI